MGQKSAHPRVETIATVARGETSRNTARATPPKYAMSAPRTKCAWRQNHRPTRRLAPRIQLAASNATRAANANALSTEPIITGPSSEPMVRDRLGEEGAARGEVDARIQRAGGLTRWKFPPRCHTTLIRLTFRLTF